MRMAFGYLVILLTVFGVAGAPEAQERPVLTTVPELDTKGRPEVFFYLIENIDKTYRRPDFQNFGKAWTLVPYLSNEETIGFDEQDDSDSYWIYERGYSTLNKPNYVGFRILVQNVPFPEEFYVSNIKTIAQNSGWKLKEEDYSQFDYKQTAYLVFVRDGVRLVCSRDIPPLKEHPWFSRPDPADENVPPDQIKFETVRFEIDM